MESRDKKGEDEDIWVYMCGGEKTKTKTNELMDERKEKKKKWPFRNITTIFSQYFHNKF